MTSPEAWIALVTLTFLEIVLGRRQRHLHLDPGGQAAARDQQNARGAPGLLAAMVMRIALLLSIAWIIRLTHAARSRVRIEASPGRDLILIVGGLFLLGEGTHEIHDKLEGEERARHGDAPRRRSAACIVQIMLLDIVFSLDSVITAVGMAERPGA